MTNRKKKDDQSKSVSSMESTIKCEDLFSTKLVGKTIKYVRYQYSYEIKDMGWSKKSLVIFFEDGSHLYSSCDEEGNNAGAYFTSIKGMEVIPTI